MQCACSVREGACSVRAVCVQCACRVPCTLLPHEGTSCFANHAALELSSIGKETSAAAAPCAPQPGESILASHATLAASSPGDAAGAAGTGPGAEAAAAGAGVEAQLAPTWAGAVPPVDPQEGTSSLDSQASFAWLG